MIEIKDVLRHELIGLYVKVVKSKNKANLGIYGKIVDETKSSLVIMHNDKLKRVFKKNIIIELTLGKSKLQIDGKMFAKKPEERIKIKVKSK